jgi:hypothetical protein
MAAMLSLHVFIQILAPVIRWLSQIYCKGRKIGTHKHYIEWLRLPKPYRPACRSLYRRGRPGIFQPWPRRWKYSDYSQFHKERILRSCTGLNAKFYVPQ